MSNVRKAGAADAAYRRGYLASSAWKARRARWFRENPTRHRCAVCLLAADERELELHHLSYDGVQRNVDGTGVVRWAGWEPDAALLPMHPLCHSAVHRVIDADHVLGHLRSRREATRRAIDVVRARLRRITGTDGIG